MSYLDSHGLSTLWSRIKAVFASNIAVDTASTTVDIKLKNAAATPSTLNTATIPAATDSKAGVMTAAEHTKLSGISVGAEANVQADWNQTNTSADDYIKNKPSIPEGSTASTTTPKMDGTAAVGTEMAFARGDHVHPHDSGKQDVIDSNHKLPYAFISGTPTIPTNNNQLTNGAGYQTAAEVQSLIDTSMVGAAKYKGTLNSDNAYKALTNYKAGEYWVVSSAFDHGVHHYDVGNMIICKKDFVSIFADTDFDVIQSDIEAIPDSVINDLN